MWLRETEARSLGDNGSVEGAALRTGVEPVATGVRVAAVAAATFWAVFFFGLIDLSIDLSIADEALDGGVYLLAIGWGLLYTVVVPGPFVLFAALGGGRVFLIQLLVTASGIALCGVLALQLGHLVPSLVLAGMAAGLAGGSGTSLRVRDWRPLLHVDWLLGMLALIAVIAAVVYADQMIRAVGDSPDDVTLGLKHLPTQAAFGVAVAGSAVVSTVAGAAGERGWRAASFPPAAAAACFGVFSVLQPDQTGSWGVVGGWAAVGWGAAFGAVSAGRRCSRG